MDGSNVLTLVANAGLHVGITINFAAQRLFWTDSWDGRIQSSDLHGQSVQTLVQLEHYDGPKPYGIAVLGDKIYKHSEGSNTCTWKVA